MNTSLHNPHLEGGPFFWHGSQTGILLIHGFTATTAEVRLLAQRLHQAGYTVSGPLLPGHNTTPEELNRVHWKDWVSACQKAYDELAAHCNTVIVGGESTGGLLSLYLGIHHPEIAALLLYAPALRLNFSLMDVIKLYLASPFIPSVPKENLDSNDHWQGYPVNPLKGAIQLIKLQKEVSPQLKQIKQPVLIVQGELDKTVHPTVPDTIFNQVSSTLKEKYWMKNSAHCVIIDQDLDDVTRLTLNFIKKTSLHRSPEYKSILAE